MTSAPNEVHPVAPRGKRPLGDSPPTSGRDNNEGSRLRALLAHASAGQRCAALQNGGPHRSRIWDRLLALLQHFAKAYRPEKRPRTRVLTD